MGKIDGTIFQYFKTTEMFQGKFVLIGRHNVTTCGKRLKRSLPESVLYTEYEYIWEGLKTVDKNLMCPIYVCQACTLHRPRLV